VIELTPESGDRLMGRAPERIRHYMEIRGIGIFFVPDLFGADSVCDEMSVDLVCRLERWREGGAYERVGLERPEEEFAGVRLPRLTLPARPGGSMATIVELAARGTGGPRAPAAPVGRECSAAPRSALAERNGATLRYSGARIVFVSGLSGSGKSTAMAALEDLSFYCVDNLPVQLIEQFLHLCIQATPPIDKIGLAVDAREEPFLRELPAAIEQLRRSGAQIEVIFLDCSDDALLNRYRETRRVHPLSPAGSVEEGIETERRLLVDVSALADHRIETSALNVHELKASVIQHIAGEIRATVVNLVSFGFRYGTPPAIEQLFDVRFLPNPYFEEGLRERSGYDPEVADYVLKNPLGTALFERLCDLCNFLVPLYDQEGKAYVTIGVGCTGGRHRSVAVVEALAESIRSTGREVNVEHRDVERS